MNNGQQSGAMSKAKGSIAVSIFGILPSVGGKYKRWGIKC